jgi:molybdopterin-guanine dinucleotide biosynthesis protein A
MSGQDKGLLEYKGKPLIQHVIDSIRGQVDEIIISANRNIDDYRDYGYTVIQDIDDHYRGPLAGISSSIGDCEHDWVLVVACDMPHLPDDLVEKLSTGKDKSNICIAETDGRLQLALLINKSVLASLQHALKTEQLSLMRWTNDNDPHTVSFSNAGSFRNFNHLEELAC